MDRYKRRYIHEKIRNKRRLRIFRLILARRLNTRNIQRIESNPRNNLHIWENDVALWTDYRFQQIFRVSRTTFKMLFETVGSSMKNEETQFGTINTNKKIAIALYFLKSGADYEIVGKTFGVTSANVSNIVNDYYYMLYFT